MTHTPTPWKYITTYRGEVRIAAQIREAVEEEHERIIAAGCIVAKNVYAKARAEAYEEAAKIAEVPISPESKYHPGECYECDCHGECPQTYIATKIRARAKEIK